jgi:ArsR family transcriptional regulator, arsenate/arsenite/antimonite-responsive transcriptional repressor
MSDLFRIADRFPALAHEVRLRILGRLRSAHPDGMVVGELQRVIGVPASTLSHHLDVLVQGGLIRQRREGRYLRSFTDEQGLGELIQFLEGLLPRAG